MAQSELRYIVPPQLKERIDKLMEGLARPGSKSEDYIDYVHGYIEASAEREYKKLLERDGIPEDPKIVSLLCEIAILRAFVTWHETRDRPPPMPTIGKL